MNSVNRSAVDKSEVRLLQRARDGDRDARRELFEQHREIAYRVALRVTNRPEDALDVVQDAFIRAFDRLGTFNRESGFRTWFLRIVTNRALDLIRARKVRLAVPLDSSDDDPAPAVSSGPAPPDAGMQSSELGDRLRTAIDALPPAQRAVFSLYATGELTYAEIAEALDIPVGTVMSRLYHARRRLHELLPDLAPPDG